jgi:recombination protein RecA
MISTGNPVLDELLGGGVLRGSITQYFGSPGAGKSMAALFTAAECQRLGGVVVWVNLESQFPKAQAEFAGCNLNDGSLIIIHQPENAEEALDRLISVLYDKETSSSRGVVDLVIIDSISALTPKQEFDSTVFAKPSDKGMAAQTIGIQARLTSKMNRIFTGTSMLQNTAMIFINQERTMINAAGPSPKGMTGGAAMQYYPKVSIKFWAPKGTDYVMTEKQVVNGKAEDVIVGHTVAVSTEKNNTGLGLIKAKRSYKVYYGKGMDKAEPVFNVALAHGVIKQPSKAYFMMPLPDGTEEKVNGRDNAIAYLRDNEDYYSFIQELIRNAPEEDVDQLILVEDLGEEVEEELLDEELEEVDE